MSEPTDEERARARIEENDRVFDKMRRALDEGRPTEAYQTLVFAIDAIREPLAAEISRLERNASEHGQKNYQLRIQGLDRRATRSWEPPNLIGYRSIEKTLEVLGNLLSRGLAHHLGIRRGEGYFRTGVPELRIGGPIALRKVHNDIASAMEDMRVELQDARAFEEQQQRAIREARALLGLLADRLPDEDVNAELVTQIDELLDAVDLHAIAARAG